MTEEKTESGSEDSEPEGVLLDEDEMNEIKKAKADEKQRKKANAAMKRLGMGEELTMIKKVEKEEPQPKKAPAKAKTKPVKEEKKKAAPAKKKKKGKSVVPIDSD